MDYINLNVTDPEERKFVVFPDTVRMELTDTLALYIAHDEHLQDDQIIYRSRNTNVVVVTAEGQLIACGLGETEVIVIWDQNINIRFYVPVEIIDKSTGINSPSSNGKVKLSPNPLMRGASLEIIADRITEVKFYNLNGVLQYHKSYEPKNQVSLNTTHLLPGVYNVLVKNRSVWSAQKLLIK